MTRHLRSAARWLVLALLVALGTLAGLAGLASPASGQESPPAVTTTTTVDAEPVTLDPGQLTDVPNPDGGTTTGWLVSIQGLWLELLAGPVVAMLTAVATKLRASAGVKYVVALALSAVLSVALAIVQAGGTLDIAPVAQSALVVFASSVVSYVFALKPSGIAPRVAASTSDIGVG